MFFFYSNMLELNSAPNKCWGYGDSLQVRGYIHPPTLGASSPYITVLLTLDLLDVKSPN